MSIALYMDEHVPSAITQGSRKRGLDVLTVQEDDFTSSSDVAVLERAAALARVVVTDDSDFKVEAARRQRLGFLFAGVIFANLKSITIGRCLADLEIICRAGEPADLANRIEYLPL